MPIPIGHGGALGGGDDFLFTASPGYSAPSYSAASLHSSASALALTYSAPSVSALSFDAGVFDFGHHADFLLG